MGTYTDNEIKKMWNALANVPFDEDEDGNLVLSTDFYGFEKGTLRERIWEWFDEYYSKGVHSLIYGDNTNNKESKRMTKKEIVRRVACEFENMFYNNIINENGGESFVCWCADGEVFDDGVNSEEDINALMDFVREITPIADDFTFKFSSVLDGWGE